MVFVSTWGELVSRLPTLDSWWEHSYFEPVWLSICLCLFVCEELFPILTQSFLTTYSDIITLLTVIPNYSTAQLFFFNHSKSNIHENSQSDLYSDYCFKTINQNRFLKIFKDTRTWVWRWCKHDIYLHHFNCASMHSIISWSKKESIELWPQNKLHRWVIMCWVIMYVSSRNQSNGTVASSAAQLQKNTSLERNYRKRRKQKQREVYCTADCRSCCSVCVGGDTHCCRTTAFY